MKVIDCVCCQGQQKAKDLCNQLLKFGARVINVDRNLVSCQGNISEEYGIWFESEEPVDLGSDMEATRKMAHLGGSQ